MTDNRSLRRLCLHWMVAVTVFDVVLWLQCPFDPFENAVLRRAALLVLGLMLVVLVMRVVGPWAEPHITMPWLRRAWWLATDVMMLLLFYRWLPCAITVADVLVLPYSLQLVDVWLAWPEEAVGLAHWRTHAAFEQAGFLSPLQAIYDTIDLQLQGMVLFFVVVKRDLTRMWEYTAAVAVAGVVSIAFLWAMPAEGPWVHYNASYAALPAEPSYLGPLRDLRLGQFTDLERIYGFLNFPSFHTVFALLIAWAMRGHGMLSRLVWALNLLVVVSTVPIGWHYIVDPLGGAVFAALAAAYVGWVSRRARTAHPPSSTTPPPPG